MTATTNRVDVYQIVTDRVVAALEAGVVPWRKPWTPGAADIPRNGITHRPYTGLNVWLLSASGFTSNRWVTFKQAQAQGTSVKKGERGTPVIFWKVGTYEGKREDGTTEERKSFLLRYYTVFNAEQLEDPSKLPVKRGTSPEKPNEWDAIAAAESILDGYENRPSLTHKAGDKAYYVPSLDAITIPAREQFPQPTEYYCTLFHELSHSTGHESRLNRLEPCHAPFGSPTYAAEELVAELGAAYLCAVAGIDNTDTEANTAAYLQSWIRALQNDKKLLVSAAAKASKAADWILGENRPGTEEEEGEE